MVVLVTCKNEEDPIIEMKALELSQHYSLIFSDASEVSDGILPKFKLIQAFIVILVTCKNEKDPSKMKALEWSQHFSHFKSMGIFPDAQGPPIPAVRGLIWPNFEPIRDFMDVLVTCKN